MNTRFILKVGLGLTVLNWILFFAIFFFFPDTPPPGPVQRGMIHLLAISGFPVIQIVARLTNDPPYFAISVPLLLLVNSFIWAVAIERLRHLPHRKSSRHVP
jgi:hypothetical protein